MCAIEDDYAAQLKRTGGRLHWTGIWPGTEECIEFGWFSRWVSDGKSVGRSGKWQSCNPGDPDAQPDFNRLHVEAVWDRKRRRYVHNASD